MLLRLSGLFSTSDFNFLISFSSMLLAFSSCVASSFAHHHTTIVKNFYLTAPFLSTSASYPIHLCLRQSYSLPTVFSDVLLPCVLLFHLLTLPRPLVPSIPLVLLRAFDNGGGDDVSVAPVGDIYQMRRRCASSDAVWLLSQRRTDDNGSI